jgi:hypothetical protein
VIGVEHVPSGDQAMDVRREHPLAFGGSWYALSSAGNQVLGQAPNSGGGYGF